MHEYMYLIYIFVCNEGFIQHTTQHTTFAVQRVGWCLLNKYAGTCGVQ